MADRYEAAYRESMLHRFRRAKEFRDVIPGIPKEVYYLSELSGPSGAHYTIFREPNRTDRDIRMAKSACRQHWDVTGFTVFRVKESERVKVED